MSIPSPTSSAFEVGPLTIHYYALCILLGITVAVLLTRSRYRARGGNPDEINELAAYAIPAGIIGGRLYHVVTSPEAYLGANGRIGDAVKIWEGGMGIWGAVALGTFIIWVLTRTKKYSLTFLEIADIAAPGLLIAQAIGRFGNWFNIELFGRPTTLPWGLEVPIEFRPAGYESFATFHPTFLYESLWSIAGALLLLRFASLQKWLGEKSGQLFLAYISIYCLGRLWIEMLRIDQAHRIGGIRLNVWVALLLLIISATVAAKRRRSPKETPL